MKKFKVKIKGISPMLHARHPSPKEEEDILKRSAKGGKKLKSLSDQEAYDMHAYKNKKGEWIQPAEMIEAAMVKAAVAFKMEGKKTFKDAIKAGIIISPVEIVHKNQKDWYMDCRWGKNPNTRGAIWVVRPRLDDWELEFTLELLLDERVSDDVVEEILKYAGLFVGIGAWRPKFGRFEVKSFKEVK
jgi:hypothetical protein